MMNILYFLNCYTINKFIIHASNLYDFINLINSQLEDHDDLDMLSATYGIVTLK